MSARLNTAGISLSLNSTAELDAETRAAIYEFRVFNMVILSLAVCILTVTAAVCCLSYYSHRRWWRKRARVYESTVGHKVKRKSRRSWSPLALLRRKDSIRDNSRIYYIYSNPLPVGHPEDEPSTSSTTTTNSPVSLKDCASDPKSGIAWDPPTFYMQL